MRRPLLLITALLMLTPQSMGGQTPRTVLPRVAPDEVNLDADELDRTTALLWEYIASRKITGAVAGIARDGKLAYMEALGVQDLATRTPMNERTLFRIYSMTKTVTAVAAMMLYEEGVWSLDDPVEMYLPAFASVQVQEEDGTLRPPVRPITVRDLLLHTSGLSHRTSELYREHNVRDRTQTLPQFVDNIVRQPLMEDPGTRYRYSESPTVVGHLIEVWSGQSLDQFFHDRIFEPLGMIDTGFWVEPGARGRLAEVYGPDANGRLAPVQIEEVDFTERPALLEGAVGLVSTVPDFLRFSQMLLNRGTLDGVRLLEPETVDMIAANGLSPEITEERRGRGWGLGNVTVTLDAERDAPSNVGEYGWNGSAGTLYWVDPSEAMVVVLMTQSSPYFPDRLMPRFKSQVMESILPD